MENAITSLVSDWRNLVLPASNGKRLIYQTTETFKKGIDETLTILGLDKPGIATPETPIQVHQIVNACISMSVFTNMPGDWSHKWLSQNQVIDFCELFRVWLNPTGTGTIFLVKKDENLPIDENNPEDNLAVVIVRGVLRSLSVDAKSLPYAGLIRPEYKYRVITPELV